MIHDFLQKKGPSINLFIFARKCNMNQTRHRCIDEYAFRWYFFNCERTRFKFHM